ncbi:MAG: DNA polymerase III subunit delta [Firmicutes bacterium]|nr:DNA polymerase III subunit delta [Bacillota bacterium]
MTPQQVLEQLRNGKRAPLYLLIGEASYWRDALLAGLGIHDPDVEVESFSDDGISAAAVIQACDTFTLFGERRLVLWEAPPWLVEGKGPSLSAGEEQALFHYLERPNENTTLVLLAAAVNGRARTVQQLRHHAVEVSLTEAKPNEAIRFVRDFFAAKGVRITPAVAEAIAFRVGNDWMQLHSECEKLLAYCAGQPVTVESVAEVVSASAQGQLFDVADLLLSGRGAEAVTLARRMLAGGESPQGLLGLLAWQYRLLYGALLLRERNGDPNALAKAMDAHPFAARNAFRHSQQLDVAAVSWALRRLAAVDHAIKNGEGSAETLTLTFLAEAASHRCIR